MDFKMLFIDALYVLGFVLIINVIYIIIVTAISANKDNKIKLKMQEEIYGKNSPMRNDEKYQKIIDCCGNFEDFMQDVEMVGKF